MKRAVAYAAWMIAVLAAAAALRLADLGNRPMHCDEAVQAVKFGRLLEEHRYVYDPHEYHGPSLNYLTLPVARASGARKLTEVSEVDLRLVPAVLGIVLVGLVWLVREELGHAAACWAALLTAVSPALVFYSRYYIQEMLLVCFTFAAIVALWRFARPAGTTDRARHGRTRRGRVFWLVLFGAGVGMMHASKETCVIAWFAIAVAAVVTLKRKTATGPTCANHPGGRSGKSALSPLFLFLPVTVLIAATVSALFYSSFLANPGGILDSYTTYFHYLGRASGEGSAGRHLHPWYDYFHRLLWWRHGDGPLYTEASIAVLALLGAIQGIRPIRRKGPAGGPQESDFSPSFGRFLTIYTLVMIAVYTAMPYKTPWCALGFWHGMILLAGVGAAALVRAAPGYWLRGLVVLLLAVATGHLAWQAYRASFLACADADNPYAYAPTTRDVPRLARRIEQLVAADRQGRAMHVQVICPDDDYWPLPWYLRDFSHVGWFGAMPNGPPAAVIVTQPPLVQSLVRYLYEDQPPGQRRLYMRLPSQRGGPWLLRPHVPLEVYVQRDLWETDQGRSGVTERVGRIVIRRRRGNSG